MNSATAAAAITEQLVYLTARVAFRAVIVAFLLWLGFARGPVRVPTLVAAVVMSVVAILMVWRLRAQREVEYHEPFSS